MSGGCVKFKIRTRHWSRWPKETARPAEKEKFETRLKKESSQS